MTTLTNLRISCSYMAHTAGRRRVTAALAKSMNERLPRLNTTWRYCSYYCLFLLYLQALYCFAVYVVRGTCAGNGTDFISSCAVSHFTKPLIQSNLPLIFKSFFFLFNSTTGPFYKSRRVLEIRDGRGWRREASQQAMRIRPWSELSRQLSRSLEVTSLPTESE